MKKRHLFLAILCMIAAFAMLSPAEQAQAGSASSRAAALVSAAAQASTAIPKPNGSVITAEETASPAAYVSPAFSSSVTLNYSIVMPKTGSMAIAYGAPNASVYGYLYDAAGTRISSASSSTGDNNVRSEYYRLKKGTYKLQLNAYPASGSQSAIAFSCVSVSAGKKVSAKGKITNLGNGPGETTSFKVKITSPGYLQLSMADASGRSYASTIYFKTKGFSDYESLTASNDTTWIGVKKGTYTFKVKTSTPEYAVKATFKKVKETSYGTKKSKAKTIKKGKKIKGLLITNAKKTHWYKFKLTKNQAVKFNFNTYLCGSGSSSGGLKLTLIASYDTGSETVYDGKRSFPYEPYTIGMKPKLKRGTYYLKIESYNKGTGYYTIKWK